MATMEHKGFMAKIEYDADIDSFFGRVVNVSSPMTFYGKTTVELREEFARSVDAWLEVCREHGIELEKPHSGRLTVYDPRNASDDCFGDSRVRKKPKYLGRGCAEV